MHKLSSVSVHVGNIDNGYRDTSGRIPSDPWSYRPIVIICSYSFNIRPDPIHGRHRSWADGHMSTMEWNLSCQIESGDVLLSLARVGGCGVSCVFRMLMQVWGIWYIDWTYSIFILFILCWHYVICMMMRRTADAVPIFEIFEIFDNIWRLFSNIYQIFIIFEALNIWNVHVVRHIFGCTKFQYIL